MSEALETGRTRAATNREERANAASATSTFFSLRSHLLIALFAGNACLGCSETAGTIADGSTADASTDPADAEPADATTGADIDAGATATCPEGMVLLFGSLCMDERPVTHDDYLRAVDVLGNDPVECAWNDSFVESLTSRSGEFVRGVDYCDALSYCQMLGRTLCGHPDGGPTGYPSVPDTDTNAWTRMCAGPDGQRQYAWGDAFDVACTRGQGCATPEGVRAVGVVWEWTSACGSAPDPKFIPCHVRTGTAAMGSTAAVTTRCDFDDRFLFDSALTRFLAAQIGPGIGFRCCRPPTAQ